MALALVACLPYDLLHCREQRVMWFLRLLLIVAGTAVGFVLGGNLTQDASGALALGFVSFLLLVLITKRRRPPAAQPAVEAAPRPRNRSFVGAVVKTFFALVGVSGVIAILNYLHERDEAARQQQRWSEEQYNNRLDQLTSQMASMSGRVFDRQTQAPLGNAAVGIVVGTRFFPLAQTAPDGSFRIDRPFSPYDQYPLQVAVISPRSGRQNLTDNYLQLGQAPQVTIYVFN